jgi:uroporphyrin-III C-methyltransferase/precorrin-2 dehydrogenase/sirohydrochlorin ferrochelatase
MTSGRVSLVGAGPGDPELWTVRALKRVQEADLVLYDALVNAEALRTLTGAQCFCVGKRAGRASVKQDTINRVMIRAARRGKRVVRLKGGDPFVFGRGAEEALALADAGISFEVVPGVTTAVAAPELAGIPVTHRGVASAFLVIAGQTGDALEASLEAIRPHSVTLVSMMGLARRGELAARLIAHGWSSETRAAIVCGASTADEWTWTGRLADVECAAPPEGMPGVIVVGDVVQIRDALGACVVSGFSRTGGPPEGGRYECPDEVKYGRP